MSPSDTWLPTAKIGIDPERMPSMNALLPGEMFFATTSDAFFEDRAQEVLAAESIDDRPHRRSARVPQALRDFMNLEPFMRKDGVVILDDCNPPSPERRLGDTDRRRLERRRLEAPRVPHRRAAGSVDRHDRRGRGRAAWSPVSGRVATPVEETVIQRYKALEYGYLAANRAEVLNLVPPARFDSLLP